MCHYNLVINIWGLTMLEDIKNRVSAFFAEEILEADQLQSNMGDMVDITPDLERVRDSILGCQTMEQITAIATDETTGHKKLSMEIYLATKGNSSQYGDSDYADRISDGIVNAIKV